MPLQRLLYVSRVSPGFDPWDARRIVGRAEMLNRRRDLTGVLGYTGRHFVQVLEGSPEALDALWPALERDPRHRDLRLVTREEVDQRRFGRWGMCLVESLDIADELDRLLDTTTPEPSSTQALQDRLERLAGVEP